MEKNKFFAKAEIHEPGLDYNYGEELGEVWGKTRDEAYFNMKGKVEQWLKINEK